MNRTLYAVTVGLLAFSPVLSIVVSDILVGDLSFWKFLWVGVALSLPISLLAARAFGTRAYIGYWAYLESFPNNSKGGIIIGWAVVTAITLLIGIGSSWAD